MNDDDFLSAMAGVKPFKQDTVRLDSGKHQSEEQARTRRLAAESEKEKPDSLQSRAIELLGPHDVVGFKSDGVQDGVYKKLRLGRYDIDGRLDLHNHTVDEARIALVRFVKEALSYDLRCVLVLPGKGGRDSSGKSILKSHVALWLEDMDEVLAFHSAQPFHGGAGAFYVLLKKSEQAKQRNRERHGLR